MSPKTCQCLSVLIILVFLFSLFCVASADMGEYLGSEYKGNFVWGGAMNLAWNEMNDNILHGKLKLNTNDKAALEMVDIFNSSSFSKNDLDEKSYYIKSGLGQKTVDLINKESKRKFPGKTFSDLSEKLNPEDMISYAYFLKAVEYVKKFEEENFLFENDKVKGFHAANSEQRQNLRVLSYSDDHRFIISLKLKNNNDELFLAKGFDVSDPQVIVDQIRENNKADLPGIGHADQFAMPKLHLKHHREYSQLIGIPFANPGFEETSIAAMV